MSSDSQKNSIRADKLRDLLNKASHAYYVLDKPFMEDSIYDQLYRELLELEKQNSLLIKPDSPSQRIGAVPSKGFKSIEHKIPLFSLDNAFSFEEVIAWHTRMLKGLKVKQTNNLGLQDLSIIGELKIDGNALALSYAEGLLVQAATRGNGVEGEDITTNVRTINSIPLRLRLNNPPKWIEIRGEAFIPNDIFEAINKERLQKQENIFANPRNACAGTLRQLNPKVVASRKLDFFAYTLHIPEESKASDHSIVSPQNQWEALQWLKKVGFKVNSNAQQMNNLLELKNFFQIWELERRKLPYETDGIVLKVNDFKQQHSLGMTQKAPRWAIAFKYPAEEASTKLITVTYQVGRTGAITPVAEFEPISLGGTIVSRATLHNEDRLSSLDIHANDTIVIHKAGEIIPKVIRVLTEFRHKEALPINMPKNCPECSSKLIREQNSATTRCSNKSCPAILRGVLRHWVSKSSMDIDGLGNKLIEQLVAKRLVSSISDLYKLDKNTLVQLDRMGIKSAENLLCSLESSKQQRWHRQLYALGIELIGEANAKALAKTFPDSSILSEVALKTPEQLLNIEGVGEEIADSLHQWFQQEWNQELLNELKKLGFSLGEKMESDQGASEKNMPLREKTFVLTGTLPTLSRSNAQQLIEEAGGQVSSSVSSHTTFVIAGGNAGSKLSKARKLGIAIINEDQFLQLLSI